MVDDCFTNINYNYKPTNISGDITAATYHEGVWLCVVSPPSWRQRTCSHRGWPSADSCWWNPDDDKGDSIDRDWITKDCGLSLQKGIWYINIYIYILIDKNWGLNHASVGWIPMTRHRSLYSQWLVASQLGETSHWPTARSASTHLRATGGPVIGLNNKMGLHITYHILKTLLFVFIGGVP